MIDAVMTVAGLFMAVTPLLLWVSPGRAVFQLVLLTCAVCAAVVIVLARIRPPEPAPPRRAGPPFKGSLPPELIARIQNQGELQRRIPDALRRHLDRDAGTGGEPERG